MCAAAVFVNRPPPLEYRQQQFNIEDVQYYSLVTVGKQLLHGVMDTGSNELIVISDVCKKECGRSSRLYHPKQSLSYKLGKLNQVLSYGSGDLVGMEAYDKFSIGPYTHDVQPFWQIVDAKMPLLLHSDFEVIVGLGPIDPEIPLMKYGQENTQAYAGELEELNITRYGFCLMQEFGAPGYIIWNDQSILREPHLFTELHTSDEGYWTARLSNVRLGNKPIACENSCGAILDSGTSLLALPNPHYNKLAHAISRLGVNCNDISHLPNLHFQLDGAEFILPPDAYLGEVEGFVSKGMARHFKKSKTSCREALMHVDMESAFGQVWIFGMPFFRTFYTIFEQGPPARIQLARTNNECHPTAINDMQLYPTRTVARPINAEKLRLSAGMQKAMKLGYIGRKIHNLTKTKE